MTTGLEYVLGQLKEIRDLAIDAPEAVSVDALPAIAGMAADLLAAIEGTTTLARQIAERGALQHGTPEDAAAEIVAFLGELKDDVGRSVRERLNRAHDSDFTLRVSEPGTVGIGQIRDEVVGFIDRISEGQFHGIEHLIHETLHARREPDPELEAAGLRILEDIRATRRIVSGTLDRSPRTVVAVALEGAQAKLNQILRDISTSSDPGALRRKLVELTEIRNVGGPISPEPYPASVDDVADEIAVFVDELDHSGSARGLRRRVTDRLANLGRQRVEQARQARIAAVLREVTDKHLRPALADLGIALPEGYALEWKADGNVGPGE